MIIALTALVVALALVAAGCTTTTKTGNGADSRLLLKGTYEKFAVSLDPSTIRVNVTTNEGVPVDVLLLDAAAYDSFATAVNGSAASWSGAALASRLNTNNVSFSYAVGSAGTYYIVVDNTGKVPGGADGSRDVFVNAAWSYA